MVKKLILCEWKLINFPMNWWEELQVGQRTLWLLGILKISRAVLMVDILFQLYTCENYRDAHDYSAKYIHK